MTWDQQRIVLEGSRRRLGAAELPGRAEPGWGYIYVLEFSGQIVKVGKGTNAANRVGQQVSAAHRFGLSLKDGWVSRPVRHVKECEHAAMRWAAEIAGCEVRGYEWFHGASLDQIHPFLRRLRAIDRGEVNEMDLISQVQESLNAETRREVAEAERRARSSHDDDAYWVRQAWWWTRYLPKPRMGWDEASAEMVREWCMEHLTGHETWCREQGRAYIAAHGEYWNPEDTSWVPTYPDPGHPPSTIPSGPSLLVPYDWRRSPNADEWRDEIQAARGLKNLLDNPIGYEPSPAQR